jgi:3-hydroxy-D-aspartate aldolase
VQAYLGHLQHIPGARARHLANDKALAVLASIVDSLRSAGLVPETVTGGGTGTHTSDLASGVFTESQAGSYAMMDAEYAACEMATSGAAWIFEPALLVASTVVSARHRSHVIVDAGIKTLSVDGPAARVIAGAAAGAFWSSMGDEHGAIFQPAALAFLRAAADDPIAVEAAIDKVDAELNEPGQSPQLGDTIWLQPGHCDPTINLHEAFLVVEPDGSWSRWPIDARRKVPVIVPDT